MAKAKLEFDLTDPDDQIEFERCNKATDLALVLWEVYNNSWRDIERSIESGELKDPQGVLDAYIVAIGEQMDKHNIVIDKLVI